ncbi:leucine--tRNA ligase [Planktosalinus lacus]|uniref:Leucine--tRNA ligase n=1 Tax=Planktosalinus lacus TaxID=1526573 RepID=A0A8J2Y7Y3_9FLAO|nr:class I tRNA ligase family protein [Planktosalinus lacus]GGD90199.1 leucine--tRNA ligase [Planktosalinus lacus]
MKYHFNDIEAKWRKYWEENQTFQAQNNSDKPKYYVLDMFPYPSGAGLHVGHPLGYIASDIYARYKRHKGFNVLHPMGYDSFGLPAEQYAIQTGQHPAITTETNINRYREQLDRIGFSFDWSREVRTSNPDYYKWTQWIFTELFHSWYNKDTDKAEPIETLITQFTNEGNELVNAVCDEDIIPFTAEMWNAYDEEQQQKILLQYRLTYLAETEVNWCPALGTVLANDEIVNGVSERGGHPVVRKKMKQWSMRITAYAQRLLDGLNRIDWPQPLKDSQTNWIGRSQGASVKFQIPNSKFQISVFTTRPDTIFGVSFMTLAPEHELVEKITTPEQKEAVEAYIEQTARRSERERMADVKTISGVFTGAYAEHPFSKEPIPIWIGDYVLASYGTGAVMAVPCGDERDYAFAKHFNIPIPNIFDQDISENAFTEKEGFKIVNSDFLNGLSYKEANEKAIEALENIDQGTGKINYRLRDAVFSRQRYWGEPFPIYYVNGLPKTIDPEHLPIQLPEVEKYLPTEDGQPPLGRADVWTWDAEKSVVVSNELIDNETIFPLELNTMPGWAGSSWYLFRYMDANNEDELASREALDYWQNVDLYIGGSEHATGHLLYSRFWTKFLYDREFLKVDEPFKKLINQGMILGESAFVYVLQPKLISPKGNDDINVNAQVLISKEVYEEINDGGNIESLPKPLYDFVFENVKHFQEYNLRAKDYKINFVCFKTTIDVKYVNISNEINLTGFSEDERYKALKNASYFDGEKVINNQDVKVVREVEKMSKSKYNVVNPDDICDQYGADTLRMYEMFLGPLEQAKPWNMAGITGVHSFLKKFWKLYCDDYGLLVTDSPASKDSLKTLHKTIKKVEEDIENFSFNTSVSTFMIAVNELTAQKCTSREVLEPLAVLISPYAPHIAEELWSKLGHTESISTAPFPEFDEKHLVESTKEYPISFNGKMRFTLELPLDLPKEEIEKAVMAHEKTQHYLEGRTPKKVIVVPGKIVNIVG